MTDSKTVAVLVRARGKINRGWCQGVSARMGPFGLGLPCSPTNRFARRWCASGAIKAALGLRMSEHSEAEIAAWHTLFGVIWPREPRFSHVVYWNDDPSRTKADVLAAFSRAIEMARRGEGK